MGRGIMIKKKTPYKDTPNLIKTKRLVLTGLIFAIAIVLSIVENAMPPIPIAVPGVKIGLSNIAVMYALFFVGKNEAILIAILKSLFVLLIKGTVAAFLSLCGGLLSATIMIMIMLIFKENVSYLIISICGSVFHNIGQFIAISVIYRSIYLWAYLPILVISGVIAGIATATLLRFILPAFKKLGLK